MAAIHPDAGSTDAREGRFPFISRGAGLVFIGLLWIALTGYFAIRQSPHPNPLRAQLHPLEVFAYPFEINPQSRLPDIQSPTRGISAGRNTQSVCVVGGDGLILFSNDGGATWTQPKFASDTEQKFKRVWPASQGFEAVDPTSPPAPEAPNAPLNSVKQPVKAATQLPSPARTLRFTYGDAAQPKTLNRLFQFANVQAASSPFQQPPNNAPINAPNNAADIRSPVGFDPKLNLPGNEKGPEAPTAPRWPHFYGTFVLDELHAWAVGEQGTICTTSDGGRSWKLETAPVENDLYDVHFANATQGVAGGDLTVLETGFGSSPDSWQPIPDFQSSPFGPPQDPNDFTPRSPLENRPIATKVFCNPDLELHCVVSVSGDMKSHPSTTVGLPTRSAPGDPNFIRAASLRFAVGDEANQAIICLWRGTEKDIPGVRFSEQRPPLRTSRPYSLPRNFEPADIAAVAGDRWAIAGMNMGAEVGCVQMVDTSFDPADRLTLATSFLPYFPYRVAFADSKRGYVLGEKGELSSTLDGGTTWFPLSQQAWDAAKLGGSTNAWYIQLPAPWFFLLGCVPAALLCYSGTVCLRRDRVDSKTLGGVEQRAYTDKPITSGVGDLMDFVGVAEGISRFLRNRHTTAPLTITIEGPWGCGKSSLMNLIREDLQKHRFQCVWFNAWHHQQEDSLLAALLEVLRRQISPTSLHPDLLAYRIRLVARKLQHPRVLLPTCAALIGAGLGSQISAESWSKLWESISNTIQFQAKSQDVLQSLLGVSGLGAYAAILRQFLARLKPLDIVPADLLATQTPAATAGSLERQTSLRYRFAQEFEDFCEAFKPRNLVIFIDDLDRCEPKAACDLLEAINFLVSSGDCFVVCGTDYAHVLKSVKQAAPHFGDDADQYLEKLVNLHVQVPAQSPEHSERIATARPMRREPVTRPPENWRERALRSTRTGIRGLRSHSGKIAAVALLFLAAWLGTWLGEQTKHQANSKPVAVVTASDPEQAKTTESNKSSTNLPLVPSIDQQPQVSADELMPRSISASDKSGATWRSSGPGALLFTGVILLLTLAILTVISWLTEDGQDIVEDSEEFTQAIKDWLPFVTRRAHTPRALKRLMNRLRYLAMMKESAGTPLSQRDLVGLAALEQCMPDWLRNPAELENGELTMDSLRIADISRSVADELPGLRFKVQPFLEIARQSTWSRDATSPSMN